MAVSKANVLAALKTFKSLQDDANAAKFVSQEAGKSLISAADQSKLDGIASGAQVNLIESITVDGVNQTPENKKVALDLSAYVKGTDLASSLSGYVKAQTGKGLSSNDFTDALKTKLETLGETTVETITEAEIQAMFE